MREILVSTFDRMAQNFIQQWRLGNRLCRVPGKDFYQALSVLACQIKYDINAGGHTELSQMAKQ